MKNKCPSWRAKATVRPRCQGRAGFAFIGAKRRPLTEQADGSGAGFSQEGQENGDSTKGGLPGLARRLIRPWRDAKWLGRIVPLALCFQKTKRVRFDPCWHRLEERQFGGSRQDQRRWSCHHALRGFGSYRAVGGQPIRSSECQLMLRPNWLRRSSFEQMRSYLNRRVTKMLCPAGWPLQPTPPCRGWLCKRRAERRSRT